VFFQWPLDVRHICFVDELLVDSSYLLELYQLLERVLSDCIALNRSIGHRTEKKLADFAISTGIVTDYGLSAKDFDEVTLVKETIAHSDRTLRNKEYFIHLKELLLNYFSRFVDSWLQVSANLKQEFIVVGVFSDLLRLQAEKRT